MVKAAFAALGSVTSPRNVANRRGKKVAEIFGNQPKREAAPEVVADV
jgi:small subunit ribosomal protein S5